jgi:serine phosphatase RsbU (regulator of sigma subunit)
MVFSLIDTGRSFQPDQGERLDLQKLVESGRKGGLGFYMIRKIMDTVEYLSTPGFNELRMTRLISKQPEKARLFMGRMFGLRVKFSVYTFLIMLTIISGAYIFIDRQTSESIEKHLHDTVASLSKTVVDQAGGYILNRRSDVEFDELVRSYVRANPELHMLVLTDSLGNILADTRDVRNLRKKYVRPDGIKPTYNENSQAYRLDDEELYYLQNRITSGRRIIGEVHATYSARILTNALNDSRRKIILLTIVGLAFGITGIYLLSNYFVSPIVRITQRVRKFSSGDIETELPLEGVEEFFEISRALNEMMTRLRRDRENIIERERVAKEIEVASQIQKTLLPGRLPDIPGLQLDAFYRAASRISGDLYDVFQIDEKKYCLLVADVSGKGIPASLIMSMLRTVIRILAKGKKGKKEAKEILTEVNEYIGSDIPAGIFITIFLGVYDIETREFNFVSAGHNPLIYLDKKEGKTGIINPAGIPLGLPLSDDQSFSDKLQQQAMEIHDGDTLFIYTDGITESMDRTGKRYGMERLIRVFDEQIAGVAFDSTQEISRIILDDIDRHCGMAAQADDITFLIINSRRKSTADNIAEIETKEVK